MFLRRTERKKHSKIHIYWSIVENRHMAGSRMVQRHVLYLGESNSSQAAAGRKALAARSCSDDTSNPSPTSNSCLTDSSSDCPAETAQNHIRRLSRGTRL
jgi:hypothetical protein